MKPPTATDAPQNELSPGLLQTLHEATPPLTAELSPARVLQKTAELARQVAGARYAALGLPEAQGGLADFITSGTALHMLSAAPAKVVEPALVLLAETDQAMGRFGLSEEEAFWHIQKSARDKQRTMRDVARAIIEANDVLP